VWGVGCGEVGKWGDRRISTNTPKPSNPNSQLLNTFYSNSAFPSFILAINSSIISKIAPEKMWEGEFIFLMGNANFLLLFRP
jgi:hypothetical protein